MSERREIDTNSPGFKRLCDILAPIETDCQLGLKENCLARDGKLGILASKLLWSQPFDLTLNEKEALSKCESCQNELKETQELLREEAKKDLP